MKRCWIGVVLLVVQLAAGIVTTWMMCRIHEPIASHLEQAGELALAGNWEQAEAQTGMALQLWEKWMGFRSCLADHNPVEEIDGDIAALKVYGVSREKVAFAAACGALAKKVEAVGDAHSVVWWNLL